MVRHLVVGLLGLVLYGQSIDYVNQIKNKPAVDVRAYASGSDTGGIQEALDSQTAAQVILYPGTYTISTTIIMPAGSSLRGSSTISDLGAPAVILNVIPNDEPGIKIFTDDVVLEGFEIKHLSANGTATSASYGIHSQYGGGATARGLAIRDVFVRGFYNNVVIDSSSTATLDNVYAAGAENDCFVSKGGQGIWHNISAVACKGDGLSLETSAYGGGVHPFITSYHSYAHGGWGVRIATTNFTYIQGCFLNNESQGGILVEAAANGYDNHHISNCILEGNGENPFSADPAYPDVLTAPAIKTESGAGPVSFTNISIYTPNGNGFQLANGYNKITNAHVVGAGLGAQAGNIYAALISGGGNRLMNWAGAPVKITGGAANTIVGGAVEHTSATVPSLEITAGTNVMLDKLNIFGGGAADALKVDLGVTLIDGTNSITGTVTNNGTRGDALPTVPFNFTPIEFADLPATGTAGQAYWCIDCSVSTAPCTAGGNVVLVVRVGAQWNCTSVGY